MQHLFSVVVGTTVAAFGLSAPQAAAEAAPVKNIVLVHGAWVGGSGWKPVYDILTKDGYSVTIVQEPLTSLQEDVARRRAFSTSSKARAFLSATATAARSSRRQAYIPKSQVSSTSPRTRLMSARTKAPWESAC